MKTRKTLKNGDFRIWLRESLTQPLSKREGLTYLRRMTFE